MGLGDFLNPFKKSKVDPFHKFDLGGRIIHSGLESGIFADDEDGSNSLPAVPKFDFPAFDPEGVDFTERKTSPLDLAPILKRTRQRQAITGVEPSAEFVSGIARPALETKAKESIALGELNLQRKAEERKQAFTEFSAERDVAFKKHTFDFEAKVKAEELRIAEIQARNSKQESGGFCIIVTACHGRNSDEVNITRKYRDKFMSKQELRGYYIIAEKIVPLMKSNWLVKKIIKLCLVNHFINVGKYRLSITNKRPSILSELITNTFLNLCKRIGIKVRSFTRCNMEVI